MVKRNRLIVVGCALGLCATACEALAPPPKFTTQVVSGSAFHPASQVGEIYGAVHTLSGTPIAAAAVQVLNPDGSARAILNADATGHFRIQLLSGTYAVVVSQPGFLRLRISNVVIIPGRTVPLNFSLAVMPPSAVSGAILHPFPSEPVGAPKPSTLPASAPAPPPPPPEEKSHGNSPDLKAQGPQQTEQVITLHPVTSSAPPPIPVKGPTATPENPADAAAAAQAKAAVVEEQQKQKEVQAFVKSLPVGLISYLVPLKMRLNQPVTVSVKIFGSQAPAALAAAAAAAGGTVPAPVSTSNYMQVYLSQEDNPRAFSIEQEGDQSPRWVSSISETDWKWIVTPKTTGTAELRFQTLVMFPDQAGKLPASYEVKDETITVTTPTMSEYLHNAWDAFLTTPAAWFEYILPGGTGFVILAWLVGRFRKKKKTDA